MYLRFYLKYTQSISTQYNKSIQAKLKVIVGKGLKAVGKRMFVQCWLTMETISLAAIFILTIQFPILMWMFLAKSVKISD